MDDFKHLDFPQKSIKNKSKETLFIEQFDLSVERRHVGLLIGKDGENIKPMCEKYAVNMTFNRLKIGVQRENVTVTISSKINQQQLQMAYTNLTDAANTIAAKRATHDEHVSNSIIFVREKTFNEVFILISTL